MQYIKANAFIKIHEVKLDQFKYLIPQFIADVKKKESGVLDYDWYLNEEAKECTILDTYIDSEPVLEHMDNVGELLRNLIEISNVTVEV
jgi:quinol monooxygenase YgiN